MIAWVRTVLFSIVFYSASLFIVGTVPITALFGQRAVMRHATFWTGVHRWAARVFLGIHIRIEGTQPTGLVLYACKHQAMFETLELEGRLNEPAMALKEELTRIPMWGYAARQYGALVVDREGSATALRQMLRDAKAALANGRSILIFPEGTRVPPGQQPPLRAGFAGLYRMLGLPVVPIAVNSGLLLPKRGAKRAGTVTFRFGEAIPPGLKREEIEARVHAAINALDVPAP